MPAGLLKQAGLVALERLPARQAGMWLVDWNGTLGVLRRLDPPPGWAADADLAADAGWVHGFLCQLAGDDFAAPRPLPVFGQRSWTVTGRGAWEVVSFIAGEVVGSGSREPMDAVGALLARYHGAACRVRMADQRPVALPLVQVPAVLASAGPGTAGGSEQLHLVRGLAGELAADLDRFGRGRLPRLVIHGDFTNHNVIAAGQPPRPWGVIDFTLAHLESPLADIGYGLWRSGRPGQDADHLDLSRVQNFVRGYASTARLTPGQAQMIPLYLRGRGLQMIAKRVRAGRPETGMLAQVQWLTANSGPIGDALTAVLP